MDIRVERFFQEFSSTIDNNAKKALFLTGVLAQHLLSIQKNDRGATPFRSQLKGLKMKEADARALLPKIQQKLEEYKKNYYIQLEKIASMYYLQAGNNWGMSVDEINFYFVLGMNLNDAKSKEGIPYFKVNKEDGDNE
ncbi:MAG: TM1802 family CRISPR-associated protein [Syntrophomonas sp.]